MQFWDFHLLNVDDAWSLLLWVACYSFECEKACCVYRYSFPDPCVFYARSFYAPLWCDLCNTSAHNVSSCPYYACYAHSNSSSLLIGCTGLEVGESVGLGVSFDMDNAFCGYRGHNLVDTPLEGCHDIFAHEGFPSLFCDDAIPISLERFHVSPMLSQPSSSSPELAFDVPIDNSEICESNVDVGNEDNMFNVLGGNVYSLESLGYFRGYDAALDPYCLN